MTRYPSKLGIGLTVFVLAILGGSSIFMILDEAWLAVGINILVILLMYILYKQTHYTVEGTLLKIKGSVLTNQEISIKEISKIKETNTLISAPAFSMDRLEIKYTNGFTIISPVKKAEFIKQLLTINPKIEVVYKNK